MGMTMNIQFNLEEYKEPNPRDTHFVLKERNEWGKLSNEYSISFLIAPCKKWDKYERHVAVMLYDVVKSKNWAINYKFLGVNYISFAFTKDVSWLYQFVWEANYDDLRALHKSIDAALSGKDLNKQDANIKEDIAKHIEDQWRSLCDYCNVLEGNNRHQALVKL